MPTTRNPEEKKLKKWELIKYDVWDPRTQLIKDIFEVFEDQSFHRENKTYDNWGKLHKLMAAAKFVQRISGFIRINLPKIEEEINAQLSKSLDRLQEENGSGEEVPTWQRYKIIAQNCAEKEQARILAQPLGTKICGTPDYKTGSPKRD